MLDPKIISALTDIEDMVENRKANQHITDDQFREMIYDKAKQIVDTIEFEEMCKEHDAEEIADEIEDQGFRWGEERV